MGSPSEQRFLIQRDNAVAAITPTASSVLPAEDTIHPGAPTRASGSTGTVRLIAPTGYTGANDTDINVEITAGGSSTARASEPVFTGAGSGTLTGLTVGATVPDQEFTFTLVSLGTNDARSATDLFGNILEAADTGAGGNNIRLLVDESNPGGALGAITRTDLDYALLSDLSADQQRLIGAQWQPPGAFELQAGSTLHPDTKRVAYKGFPTVYRTYLAIEDGKTVIYYDKPIVRTIPAETVLQEVTGGYAVTVTNGVTTETYTDIVTLYDLFRALLSSGLVRFREPFVITEDETPGGMAVDDLPLRTDPWVLGVTTSGSEYVQRVSDIGATAVSGSPTETLAITCTDNATTGREAWSVRGSVSAALANATTGVPYNSGGYAFRIPVQLPDGGTTVEGEVAITEQRFSAETSDAETYPTACLRRYVLGISAQPKTFRFVWTRRPPAACGCDDVQLQGLPRDSCLGLDVEGSTVATSLAAGHAARLQDLHDWFAPFAQGQADLGAAGPRTAIHDEAIASAGFGVLHDLATDLYTNGDATLSYPAWVTGVAVSLYEVREPSTRNGYLYRVTVAGTTGGTEPTWPTVIGDTVTDNGITWRCIAKIPETQWDDLLSTIETALTGFSALHATELDIGTVTALSGSTAYSVGDVVTNGEFIADTELVVGTPPDSDTTLTDLVKTQRYYAKCIKGGTSFSVGIPDFQAIPRGQIFNSGTAWFISLGLIRTDGGGDDITEVEDFSAEPHISRQIADFARAEWLSQANRIRIFAGIDPGKSDARAVGSPCWTDPGDDEFFVVNGGEYLPMFLNQGWHSAKLRIDPDGNEEIYSTQELYLGIAIGCSDQLALGDSFTVTVAGVGADAPKAYDVGDLIRVEIIGGSPRYLTGGVTGNKTHRWAGRGSVAGALADYDVIDGAEVAYSGLSGDLAFTITRGGVPNRLGDTWRFSVFSRQWRWRRDGGSWSAAADIPATATALADGLQAEFIGGPGVSFDAGDSFPFTVYQPYSPSHAILPTREPWQWSGASATLTMDFGADTDIDALALWHDLPAGAVVTWEGLDAGGSVLWTETTTYKAGLILALPSVDRTARQIRLSVASATGGRIWWVWVGEGLSVEWDADTVRPVRGYDSAGRVYRSAGWGLRVEWANQSPGSTGLPWTDIDRLVSMVDSLRADNNRPAVVVANRDQGRGYLCRLSDDDIEIEDLWEFGTTEDSEHNGVALNFERVAV